MRTGMLALLLVGCAAEPVSNQAVDRVDTAPEATDLLTGCDYQTAAVDADYSEGALDVEATLDALQGPWAEALQWTGRNEETTVQLEVLDVGLIQLAMAMDPSCEPQLLLETEIALWTDDGRLDEVVGSIVRHTGDGAVRLQRWVAFDQLAGDWSPAEVDPEIHTAVDVEITADLASAGSTGVIALHALRGDGETDSWTVAFWPAEMAQTR